MLRCDLCRSRSKRSVTPAAASQSPHLPAYPTSQIQGSRRREERGEEMAKMTGAVNIAVFAAFAFCIRGVLLSNAAFKPVCAAHELDMSCYGRQKRQET